MPKIEVKFAPDDENDPLKETASDPYETANDLIAERLKQKLPGLNGPLIRRRKLRFKPDGQNLTDPNNQ